MKSDNVMNQRKQSENEKKKKREKCQLIKEKTEI